MLIIERIPVGPFQMNSYVAGCSETMEGIYVDPGAEVDRVIETARRLGLRLVALVGTHAHLDHAEGVCEAKAKLGLPYLLHEAERHNLAHMPDAARVYGFPVPPVPEVDGSLVPGEHLRVGNLAFEIRLTDGHAPGNVTLYWPGGPEGPDGPDGEGAPGHAIVGDALFAGSVGRTDLYMGDGAVLLRSVRTQLLTLPPETIVHPGHGPETTIGRELAANPFCQPGAEALLA